MRVIYPSRMDLFDREIYDATWAYRSSFPIRHVYLSRLESGLQLLPRGRSFKRVLDLGTGCGILLPTVSGFADEVVGLDKHDRLPFVQRLVRENKVLNGVLIRGSVEALPFGDGFFDLITAFSVFEHLEKVETLPSEIARVLAVGGLLLVGLPAESFLVRLGFKVTGVEGRFKHNLNYNTLFPAFSKILKPIAVGRYPRLLPSRASLYFSFLFRKE